MNTNPDDLDPVDDDVLADISVGASEAQDNRDAEGSALQKELDDTKERLLRTQAEIENVRRRLQRDSQDSLRFATQSLLTDLLPVLDNIERAIEAASKSTDASGLLEGVKMVQQQLMSTLERHNCTPVPAEGQVFDPTLHEAIAQFPNADVAQGSVVTVNQKGYQLHDRVIRPAQVVVSSGPPADSE